MKIRTRRGQTLIEVVMATMISAMTTTAVFSVILSSFVSDNKADKRDAAAMVLKQAQETLKSYVSAVPGEPNYVPGSPSGHWPAEVGGTWALREGNHDVSSLVATLPLTVPGQPAATLTYTVASYPCGFGTGNPPNYSTACKRVVFTLTYPD